MYDWLDQIEELDEVQLAHPYRVKAIAAAQVKTDSVDAGTLADLLRANLIPRAHIPTKETRALKEMVRQRVFLVRMRTMVKNSIHALLDRYHVLAEDRHYEARPARTVHEGKQQISPAALIKG